jgi:glyoxylase-like metal-dependent hydrolase (beta-lactamase superfamily II)
LVQPPPANVTEECVRVWVFSAGTIDASSRLMLGRGPLTRGYTVSLTCVLLERPEGLVLVDTGWGSPTASAPGDYPGWLFEVTAGKPRITVEETAAGRLRALGFRPEDVTDVVLTHLDIDHVGGLVDLPNARVHVSRAEHVARFERRQPFRSWIHDSSKAFAHAPRFSLARLVDHEDLGFPRSADLFGDGSVTLLDAQGHTPGHCAVAVRAGGKTLVHAGDAFVHTSELGGEEGLPLGVLAYRWTLHEDKPTARRTLDILRRLPRERPEVSLVNAHDTSLLARLPSFPAPFADG